MNYLKKIDIFRIVFVILFVTFLSACGSENNIAPNATVIKVPAPLQKLAVGDGELTAYVLLDGSRTRIPMVINNNGGGTASVELPGLTRAIHNVIITYEYTDDTGSFILAQSNQEVNLTSGSQTLNVAAETYGFAFDEDRDGITNTDELLEGTDPRIPAFGSGNLVTLDIATSLPLLSDSAQNVGTLRAFVVIEGNPTPVDMVINNETGLATVSISGVRQIPRDYTITFEYTDNISPIIVARIDGTVDLRFVVELNLNINDFDRASFNEDGDGASNAYELSVGGNPRLFEKPTIASNVSLIFEQTKIFRFIWDGVDDATFYRVLEDIEGISDFQPISGEVRSEKIFDHIIPLYSHLKAQYKLQSCNNLGCTDSEIFGVSPMNSLVESIGYFKSDGSVVAGDSSGNYNFGGSVSLSDDGLTMAVGDAKLRAAIFNLINGKWSQQTLLRGSNELSVSIRSNHIALSGDGNTLALAVPFDFNNTLGVKELLPPDANGFEFPVYANSGAVYIFTRTNGSWSEEAFIKASNLESDDLMSSDISISDDGNTLVVGAPGEDSNLIGSVSGAFQDNNLSIDSGAVYVFTRSVQSEWRQQAYIKASTNSSGDGFGSSVNLSGDGLTLVVGAPNENSNAIGVGGDQLNNGATASGAVYVFNLNQPLNNWTQEAYVKASNTEQDDNFGFNVELNKTGNVLAVTASGEDSGVPSNQNDNSKLDVGAVYVFERDGVLVNGNDWEQQGYLKPETNTNIAFGYSLSLSDDGSVLAISDVNESSEGVGLNSVVTLRGKVGAGSVYIFERNIGWIQQNFIKSINTEGSLFNATLETDFFIGGTLIPRTCSSGVGDRFGSSISLSGDGGTLAVGAECENGASTGINSIIDETTDINSGTSTTGGAVYLY